LYLDRNGIKFFDPGTFDYCRQIQKVSLNPNDIETLPQEVFSFLFQERKSAVFVKDNPVNCDCQMKWLQKYILENNVTNGDIRDLFCTSPPRLHQVSFIEADLCQEATPTQDLTSSTSSQDTTVTKPNTEPTTETSSSQGTPTDTSTSQDTTITNQNTEPPTTSSSSEISSISQDTTTSMSTTPENPITEPSHTTIICHSEIKSPLLLHLSSPDKSPFFQLVDNEDAQGIDVLLKTTTLNWPLSIAYTCPTCQGVACPLPLTKSQKTFTIPHLNFSTEYVICIFEEFLHQPLTFNRCQIYKTLPPKGQQPWIVHAEKTIVAVSISIALAAMLLIGAAAAFCIVRGYPTLLRGSGRVEVVKSRNGEFVLVMPEGRDSPPPTPSSLYETISGYISFPSRSPPPLPPFPAYLNREPKLKKENEYLEPIMLRRLPKNMDLLLEYEWYTSQQCANHQESRI